MKSLTYTTVPLQDPDRMKKANFAAGYKFLAEHLDRLLKHGWTRPELFRRNKSKGIAWLPLWTDRQITWTVGGRGQVVFTLHWKHGTVIQTAWPQSALFN